MKLKFWPFNRTKPEPAPLRAALKIWYQYSPTDIIRHFTYSTEPGRGLQQYRTTRQFLKWYFGRPQSRSIFLTGSDNRLEWVREHILCIETFADERDAETKKR